MSATLIGSCRISKAPSNDLNEKISYCHSTKEAIQFIKFLKNDITIPDPYNIFCFRTAIVNKKNINYTPEYKTLFDKTTVFVIEICSNKKYIHNGFYLHHLSVDNRFAPFLDHTPEEIKNSFKLEKQSDEEIENDILEIKSILDKKKFVIVSHYNVKKDGEYMPARNHLINLLDNICKKYNIHFINPTEVLSGYTQKEVIHSDLGHYTGLGYQKMGEYISNYIKNI